jgi:hypothetical protein
MKDEAHKQEAVRAWFTADEFVEMAERRTKEWAKQADIPDLIAGALGVSRGTAYDLMRDALKEAAPVQEPVIAQEGDTLKIETILYTSPQLTWVGLTDEEKRQIFEREDYQGWLDYINAIEAKLKEKNNG